MGRFLFFFVVILVLCAQVLAQNDASPTLQITKNTESLKVILERFSSEHNIEFSYSSSLIDTKIQVEIPGKTLSLNDFLENILPSIGIQFKLVKGKYILKPKKDEASSLVPKQFIFTGHIKDQDSRELLPGAYIYFPALNLGGISNEYGYFSFKVPQGQHQVTFSYLGYTAQTIDVEVQADSKLDYLLKASPTQLKEIQIVGKNQIDLSTGLQSASINLYADKVSQRPFLLGEEDLLKSLQNVPGVTFGGDGSVFFYVRGGGRDENLVLVDDAPVYNPSHMLGFFSTLIPEAVVEARLYKGDMPLKYGGGLSSLLYVRTKEGNKRKYQVEGGVGLASWRLAVEGPIKKEKSSFFVNYRRSYINPLLFSELYNWNRLAFYDFNAKLNFDINKKNKVFLTYYQGQDFFFQNNDGLEWGNRLVSTRWNHLFGKRLFANFLFYYSDYNYFLYQSIEDNERWTSSLTNGSLKADFNWFVNPESTLNFGFKFTGHKIDPGNFRKGDGSVPSDLGVVSPKNANLLSLYAEYELKASKKVGFSLGVKTNQWGLTGESFEFTFDEGGNVIDSTYFAANQDYFNTSSPELRFNTSYLINSNVMARLTYARTVQFLHLVSNSISPFNSLEVWMPSGPNLKPAVSNQISLNLEHQVPDKDLKWNITLYHRNLHNIIDYRQHANLLLNPYLELELLQGQRISNGLETMVTKSWRNVNLNVGYSLSKTDQQVNGVNGDEWYPANQDRRHQFNAELSLILGPRLRLYTDFLYMSGSPFTSPSAFYYYNNTQVPIYTRRNNDRLPDYHRWNMAIEYRLNRNQRRFKHDLTLSLYNLYNRQNPIYINFNKMEQGDDVVVPGNTLEPVDLVSTRTYVYGFVPSLSYHFKFN